MNIAECHYYASHLPALAALGATVPVFVDPSRDWEDPVEYRVGVVECGVGYYSTPLLTALVASRNGVYHGYDGNAEWIESVKALCPERSGTRFFRTEWLDFRMPDCDIAFIDGHEDSRRPCLMQAMPRAGIIALHDADGYDDHFYHCREIWLQAPYYMEFKPPPIDPPRQVPSTVIVIPRDGSVARQLVQVLRPWVDGWRASGCIVTEKGFA